MRIGVGWCRHDDGSGKSAAPRSEPSSVGSHEKRFARDLRTSEIVAQDRREALIFERPSMLVDENPIVVSGLA